MEIISNVGRLETLLGALAELLAADGHAYDIVVIGGSGLIALGVIARPTGDVDVLAILDGGWVRKAEPLPGPLLRARDRVAQDFRLPGDRLNAGPASLIDAGLPTVSWDDWSNDGSARD